MIENNVEHINRDTNVLYPTDNFSVCSIFLVHTKLDVLADIAILVMGIIN